MIEDLAGSPVGNGKKGGTKEIRTSEHFDEVSIS